MITKVEEVKNTSRISVVNLKKFVPPSVKFTRGKEGLLFLGRKNEIYNELVKYREESPTNGAIIGGVSDFILGHGIVIKRSDNEASDKANIERVFNSVEVEKIVEDFSTFSEGAYLVIKNKSATGKDHTINKIVHIERDIVTPFMDSKGNVIEYWSDPFKKWSSKEECDIYPVFDPLKFKERSTPEIVIVKKYQSGRNFISVPAYIQALNYAILEAKISVYAVNHISKGFSAGNVVNFNNGEPKDPEVKKKIEEDVKSKFTGEDNAGSLIISWNNDKNNRTIVDTINQNTSHQQWEFWTKEARQQIMVGHRVTSPVLFGIKEGSGLGNNAEELETAFELYMQTVIAPKQRLFINSFKMILNCMGINSEISFNPLLSFKDAVTKQNQGTNTNLSTDPKNMDKIQDSFSNELTNLGEDMDEFLKEYEPIAISTIFESQHMIDDNNVSLAKTFSSFWKWASEQDNDLFKVRYSYAPATVSDKSRDFCVKMVNANKVYRKEDIESAENKVVNAGFGLRGADTYSIWLYKGGVNCQHFWQRVIYLKKNNSRITVNEARQMILSLPPSERHKYRLDVNDPRVAQVAEEQNNFWRVSRLVKNFFKNIKQ